MQLLEPAAQPAFMPLQGDWVVGTYQLRMVALIKAVRSQLDVPSHHELTRSARNNTYLYLLWCFRNYLRSTEYSEHIKMSPEERSMQ